MHPTNELHILIKDIFLTALKKRWENQCSEKKKLDGRRRASEKVAGSVSVTIS
jgi:hypothetical protein